MVTIQLLHNLLFHITLYNPFPLSIYSFSYRYIIQLLVRVDQLLYNKKWHIQFQKQTTQKFPNRKLYLDLLDLKMLYMFPQFEQNNLVYERILYLHNLIITFLMICPLLPLYVFYLSHSSFVEFPFVYPRIFLWILLNQICRILNFLMSYPLKFQLCRIRIILLYQRS